MIDAGAGIDSEFWKMRENKLRKRLISAHCAIPPNDLKGEKLFLIACIEDF